MNFLHRRHAFSCALRYLICCCALPLYTVAQSSVPNPKASPSQDSPAMTAPAKSAVVAPLPSVEKPVSGKPEASAEADASAPTVPLVNPAEAAPRSSRGSKASNTQSPAASSADPKSRARRAYVIGPEDILLIKVWQEPNLSGQVVVGADGMISLQLIDEVKADGLTAEQLKNVITDRLRAFIVDPDVNIQLIRGNSQKFIIQGEVVRPGSFSLTGPTTVMEALVSGGGFREFAKTNKIYILRTKVDPKSGKVETEKFNFNYKEVSHGKKMEQDILIQNGDKIFVP